MKEKKINVHIGLVHTVSSNEHPENERCKFETIYRLEKNKFNPKAHFALKNNEGFDLENFVEWISPTHP